MIADSADVDTAIVGILAGDPILTALLPGGIWWDKTARSKTSHYAVIRHESHSQEPVLPGRVGVEKFVYAIESVVLVPDGSDESLVNQQAAQQIYALLHNATLTPPHYHPSTCLQRIERGPRTIDIDEQTNTRWDHRPALYEVWITPQE